MSKEESTKLRKQILHEISFSLEMRSKENGQSHYNTGNVFILHQILSDTSYCFIGKFSSTGSLLISHFLDCSTESLSNKSVPQMFNDKQHILLIYIDINYVIFYDQQLR